MSALLAARLGLLLLGLVTGYAWWQRRRGGLDLLMRAGLAVNLLGAAVLWIRTDKPVEGPTVVPLGTTHGVTVADLLVGPALLLVLLLARDQRVSARLKRR